MVAGVPCMCMRTTGTPLTAQSGKHPRVEPPGRDVVHEVGPGREGPAGHVSLGRVDRDRHPDRVPDGTQHGEEAPPLLSAGTGTAPGRVDSAPTSASALRPPPYPRPRPRPRIEVDSTRREGVRVASGCGTRTTRSRGRAESTRPGAVPVPAEEERRRLLPVLRAVRDAVGVPISVDTTKADVARGPSRPGPTS